MSDDLPRDAWAVDVMLLFVNPDRDGHDTELPLLAASWTPLSPLAGGGWQLGGLLSAGPADLSSVERVQVTYPDGGAETLVLAEAPTAHAKTGDPRGTFTTLRIGGRPQWPGAAAQHEAMLHELRAEGFTIEGDAEPEAGQ